MDTSYARLKWQCRRGMLELDCLLQGYLDAHYDSMSDEEKRHFAQLLENEDQSLYEWCMGYHAPVHQSEYKVIQAIRTCRY